MSNRVIEDSIRKLAGTDNTDRVYSVDAEVTAVDLDTRTCTVVLTGAQTGNVLEGVRLMATVDDGLLIEPEMGSSVIVIFSTYSTPYVAQYSGVASVTLRGGDLGGLIRINDLVTKLNNLEQAYNDLVTKFNMHTHNVTGVGSPTGPNINPETTVLVETQKADIENEKITHG